MATKTAEPTTEPTVEPVTAQAEPVTVPATEPTAEPVKDTAWWEGKARAMEAEKVATAKKLAKLEAAEQARQEAELSELQKTQKRAEDAERKAKAAELGLLRRDVIPSTGLPAAFADRLNGETLEEMEADAKLLLAAMPAKVAPKLDTTNPGQPQTGETDAQRRKRLGL